MLNNSNVVFEFKNQQTMIISWNSHILYKQSVFNSQGVCLLQKKFSSVYDEKLIVKECFLHAWVVLYRCGLVDDHCNLATFSHFYHKFLDESKLIIS